MFSQILIYCMTTLTTVSRPMGMRPRNLISVTVDTPALPTAPMTLVGFIESILLTGGDIRPYTRKSDPMSGNITSHVQDSDQVQYSIESERVSQREMIYAMSENITVTSETSLTHIRFNFTAACHRVTTLKHFLLSFFRLFINQRWKP